MKRSFSILFLAIFAFLVFNVNTYNVFAATFNSHTSGSWTDGSTWGMGTLFSTNSQIGFDLQGNIYVADQNNHQVVKLNSLGIVTNTFDGAGSFSYVDGVTIDSLGNIYVSDTGNDRVVKLDSTGNVVDAWGSFSSPVRMAHDTADNIYVANAGANSIVKINSAGVVSNVFTAGFSIPESVAVDSVGNLYVADFNNHRIVKLDPLGTVLTTFTAGSSLSTVIDVSLDSSNNIYIADYGNNCIVKLDSLGNFLDSFTGELSLPFSGINGMSVDSVGNIYVSDTNHVRVVELDSSGGVILTFDGTQIDETEGVTYPGSTDDAYIDHTVSLAENQSVKNLNINDGVLVTNGNNISFSGSLFNNAGGTITGDVTFTNEGINRGTVTGNATFEDTSSNQGTVTGDSIYIGDLSTDDSDSNNHLIRKYLVDTIATANFSQGGNFPWTVIADGAKVNIFHTTYDNSVIFQTPNHGSFDHSETFLGYESFDTEPSPSSLGYLSTTTNFNKALNIDETYWNTSGESIFDSQIVKIKSNLAHITNPKFTTSWTGHADTDATVHLSIFNFSKNTWEELTSSVCNTDCTLVGEKTGTKYKDSSDFSLIWIKSKYINTDQISLAVSQVSTGGSGGGGGGGGSNPTPNPATIPVTPITTPVPTNPTDCLQGYKFSPSTGKLCTGTTTYTPPTTLPSTPSCTITTTLKQGMKGEEVKCLQTKLNITSDGAFGPKTKLSVMNFQKLHLLTPDGVVGPKTRGELNK